MAVRSWSRLLPAVLVAALLSLAAMAPNKPPATPMMPAPPPPMGAVCEGFQFTAGGDSTALFSGGDGFMQPLPANLTVAACSLRVKGTGYCGGTVKAFEWDPVALAPTAGSVRLRYSLFDPSTMGFQGGPNTMPTLSFFPPIVTTSVCGRSAARHGHGAGAGAPMAIRCGRLRAEGHELARRTRGRRGGTHDLLIGSHRCWLARLQRRDADRQLPRVAVGASHGPGTATPAELVQPSANVITDVLIEFAANGARTNLPS
jgi:hypothetical protein